MTTNISARILATPEDVRDDDLRHHNAALVPALAPGLTPAATTYPTEILLANLDGTNGFRIDGHAASDFVGWSVGVADVNGDGFGDLLIGATGVDYTEPNPPNTVRTNAGEGYVLYGSAAGFAAHADVASLADGTSGFALQGWLTSESLGAVVSDAGDVNGDGIEDFVVADRHGHIDFDNTSSAFVVFGQPGGGFPALTNIKTGFDSGTFGFYLPVPTYGQYNAPATHGDINGDGFDDIIIANSKANGATGHYAEGRVYVAFGHAGTFPESFVVNNVFNGDGSDGFRLIGAGAFDQLGYSADATGDINGDGINDMIFGSPGAANNLGKVVVVFGKATGWAASQSVSAVDGTNGFNFDGAVPGSGLGIAVASAGDMNGDGFDDVAIGDPYFAPGGAVYVVFGHAGAFANDIGRADLNATNGLVIQGLVPGDRTGWSLSSAGDINGDGFDDLIIGAYAAGAAQEGVAYVVFGAASFPGGVVDLATLGATGKGFKITGESHASYTGWSVSAGDMNGDGVPDIIVGANAATHDGKSYAGSTYVVYGIKPTSTVTLTGTNGKDNISGSDLADTLGGSNGNDTIYGNGGNDLITAGVGHVHLYGGTGNDGFAMHGTFDSRDIIDGGAGTNDQIGLEGDYSGGVTLDGTHVKGIEVLAMMQGFDYKITVLDNFLSAGQVFTFWSVSMGAPNHVFLDGHLETDGIFNFFLGHGGDTAIGGGGGDLFYGEGGADHLTGNGGADTFAYLGVSDSNGAGGTAYDTITDFTVSIDKIKLAGAVVSAVDAAASGTLSAGSFDSDLAAVLGAGQSHELDAGHAVLFTASGGLNGHTFLIVGTAGAPSGYLAGADYVIEVPGVASIATSDFI